MPGRDQIKDVVIELNLASLMPAPDVVKVLRARHRVRE
jgi:hypothetical protein